MFWELLGGLFGWGWIIFAAAAAFFFIKALFFDGRWSSFFWCLAASAVGKWILRGTMDHRIRVHFEEELKNRGFDKEKVGIIWSTVYWRAGNDGINQVLALSNEQIEQLMSKAGK